MHAHTIPDLTSHPRRRLWTYSEFMRAGKYGVFRPDERLELIEGEIITVVQPTTPKATTTLLIERALRAICPQDHFIRTRCPLRLGIRSCPEPYISVVAGDPRDYLKSHPKTAALVIEVADGTLQIDRRIKASLYARAEVREYWIVDVMERAIEVYREPMATPKQSLGHHYGSISHLTVDDFISPLIAPTSTIAIADLLP